MRAFWKYDYFPFYLSGTINGKKETMTGREMIQTKEFGVGFWFYPIFTISNKKGFKLKKSLETLRSKRVEELRDLEIKYKNKVNELMKEYINDRD